MSYVFRAGILVYFFYYYPLFGSFLCEGKAFSCHLGILVLSHFLTGLRACYLYILG